MKLHWKEKQNKQKERERYVKMKSIFMTRGIRKQSTQTGTDDSKTQKEKRGYEAPTKTNEPGNK